MVNELEQAIETLDKVQPSLQDVLFERYFRNGRYTFAPTEKQKKYLASLDTLKVLCIDHDAPYVYQKNGKPAGFIILELSINNKLNNEHEVKKSERGKRGYRMRKTRSDCRVGTFEKKNGLPPGTVKKPKTPSPSILIQINRR